MSIPKWLNNSLHKDNLTKIEEAVRQAELKTSGEVVPMIVHRSSTVGHIPLTLLLLLSSLYFVFDLYHYQLNHFAWHPILIIISNLFLLLLSVRLLAPLHIIGRIFTPKNDQALQVETRAFNEFFEHRVHQTENSTGILIFISMMEHRAFVLGDEAISQKIPQKDWDDIIKKLIQGIKQKDLASGLCDAIKMSGDLLEEHFPIQKDDENELSNQLIIKE